MCSHETGKIFFHEWIGYKKKKGNTKLLNFLLTVHPNKKIDEVEMLAALMTPAEAKKLAQAHGYDDKQIEKMLK
jgi:hypothetical protein